MDDRFSLILLDDVVMSVDLGHRYQFCKLLKTQFPDTQFIITTHDRLWAEQMKQLNTNQLERLAEIKEQILVLLSEALDLVRGTPEEQRANHWFATFCTALDKDNTQGSESTITMQETIDALKESADA